MARPEKITLVEMRESGMRRVLVYCGDFRCSHHMDISADQWPYEVGLSDLEQRFVCPVCGRRGADVRPNFDGRRFVPPGRP